MKERKSESDGDGDGDADGDGDGGRKLRVEGENRGVCWTLPSCRGSVVGGLPWSSSIGVENGDPARVFFSSVSCFC